MLVLDTDLITHIQVGTGEAYQRLHDRLEAASATEWICVTIVSFEEQARGWLAQIAKAKDPEQQIIAYRRLHTLLDDYAKRKVLDFDAPAAQRFGELKKAKLRMGTMDLRIAAIASVNDAILLTRNVRDFAKVPGLRVEDWTVAPQE